MADDAVIDVDFGDSVIVGDGADAARAGNDGSGLGPDEPVQALSTTKHRAAIRRYRSVSVIPSAADDTPGCLIGVQDDDDGG